MSYTFNNNWDTIDLSDLTVDTMASSVFTITSASPTPVLTTSSMNGTSGGWITADPNLKGSTLQVKGDAEFDGDVTIKGKSINDSLERIEERLAILRPNEELEAKWENLRDLRKAYMELEAEIIEKEKVWGILKK